MSHRTSRGAPAGRRSRRRPRAASDTDCAVGAHTVSVGCSASNEVPSAADAAPAAYRSSSTPGTCRPVNAVSVSPSRWATCELLGHERRDRLAVEPGGAQGHVAREVRERRLSSAPSRGGRTRASPGRRRPSRRRRRPPVPRRRSARASTRRRPRRRRRAVTAARRACRRRASTRAARRCRRAAGRPRRPRARASRACTGRSRACPRWR